MSSLFDNKYLHIKELGSGGFGKVFLAKEKHTNALIAIKQLKSIDPQKQDNIIHEMQVISKFNHPHIVNYKHHFKQDEFLFIVMEYCGYGNLREVMKLPETVELFTWKWMLTLTDTLNSIHEKGIVHHDIKPDNILFTDDRVVKIADFGVANWDAGTKSYMSPEMLDWKAVDALDPRTDIYALGVTLLELITGKNPFSGKTYNEIISIHDQKQFGINHLPNWQQEIIQKAIARIPEQRFQTMTEFHEAIQAQSVPLILDKDVIRAGDLAEKAERLLKRKQWSRSINLLNYAEKTLKTSVNVLTATGRYHLLQENIETAKTYFEKALKWNPRLDVQKELGWIQLRLKNYPTAISLLSDHVHRNPSDYEAYNLIIQCFYETNRYEQAMDLARTLLDVAPDNHCFANNYYISSVMKNIGNVVFPETVMKADKEENDFLNYNYSLVLETEPTHKYLAEPTLKSKLLFMDYRFLRLEKSMLYFTNTNAKNYSSFETQKTILKFGRESYDVNDIEVPGGTSVSRRHCLIINAKNDIWLYDLGSTGSYVNSDRISGKKQLIGRNLLQISKAYFEITNDINKLI